MQFMHALTDEGFFRIRARADRTNVMRSPRTGLAGFRTIFTHKLAAAHESLHRQPR